MGRTLVHNEFSSVEFSSQGDQPRTHRELTRINSDRFKQVPEQEFQSEMKQVREPRLHVDRQETFAEGKLSMTPSMVKTKSEASNFDEQGRHFASGSRMVTHEDLASRL